MCVCVCVYMCEFKPLIVSPASLTQIPEPRTCWPGQSSWCNCSLADPDYQISVVPSRRSSHRSGCCHSVGCASYYRQCTACHSGRTSRIGTWKKEKENEKERKREGAGRGRGRKRVRRILFIKPMPPKSIHKRYTRAHGEAQVASNHSFVSPCPTPPPIQ